jgi:integrase
MARRITGSIFTVKRQRGEVWYVKVRIPDPQWPGRVKQTKRLLGPAWTERGRPPAGYYTAKLAEQELQAILTDARRGVLPVGVENASAPTGATFAEAVDEWVRHVESEGASPAYVQNCGSVARRYLIERFGADVSVADITTEQVDALRDDLLREGRLSRRTVQRIMIVAHGIFKQAKRKKWIVTNPCEDAKRVKPDAPSGVLNVLSVEEVYELARAADDEQQAALYITAALTGLRMGELRALRWMDVDFGQRAVHVRQNYAHSRVTTPKSGKVRSLPMADQVAVALDGLSKRERFTQPGDLVFPNAYGHFMDDKEIRHGFYGALKRAGLGHKREGEDPFVFHDLRHTFGTLCASSGVPVGDIQHYMGHAHLETTQIYMHFAPKHDAAERLTAAFGGTNAREPEPVL